MFIVSKVIKKLVLITLNMKNKNNKIRCVHSKLKGTSTKEEGKLLKSLLVYYPPQKQFNILTPRWLCLAKRKTNKNKTKNNCSTE